MLTNLKKYHTQCATVQKTMDVHQQKIPYGPHPRQYAIVVQNRDPALRQPNKYAFYFHGGAWTFGQPETFTPAAIPWLRMGFTVILPSYRRPPFVGLNRIVTDCWAAVNHFRPASSAINRAPATAPTTEQQALTDPIIHLGGISAGAHLAAVLATQPQKWLAAGWGSAPEKALLCAGPLSLGHLRTGRLFLPRYDHLDPIQLLRAPRSDTPIDWQLLHGTSDPVVAPVHSQLFLEKLQSLGHQANLRYLKGGRHLDAGRWMFGETASDTVANFLAQKPAQTSTPRR
ncbi:alpha/beta hydrolase [Neolewinella antarctica]|uniref:Acetyl esterase/lipase n=1 Tax=Neolewinella antarctica TaxID=442734 RepID=A0ABX0X9D3_9BACT|nr:alpha/beta hydrolase [Neolewinella antarctica]NJC25870.1 acetyl esterase/lipase [Neolewinella antarctica]